MSMRTSARGRAGATAADVHLAEYSTGQSGNGGLFLLARYFWPFELAVLLGVTLWIASRRGRQAAQQTGRELARS